jgi:hypothetical protein
VWLRFNWTSSRPADEYLGVPLAIKREDVTLWHSPGGGVDLACIALELDASLVGRATVPAVSLEAFADEADVFEGAQVLALGFPGTGDSKDPWSRVTRPLLRHGIVSWVAADSPLENLIVTDISISPGNSGGPVFRVPAGVDRVGNFALGKKVAFLGIATRMELAQVPLMLGGKALPESDDKGNPNVMGMSAIGLGVIEPAGRVKMLLEEASKRRGQRPGA